MVVPGAVSSPGLLPPATLGSRALAPVTIDRLVRDHGAFVWRSVRRLGVAEGDVDDVVQQVFLRTRERLDDVPADNVRGFLY
ncbi:MAG: sigma-70 family RNA polymerase sigma factor, partial [Proteobacteria bacterium]